MVKEEEKIIISFIETVKVLKKRYKKCFVDMTIFMSFKNRKYNFIFQQLNSSLQALLYMCCKRYILQHQQPCFR